MLNSDWRNLSDNAREFNLRSYWSLDSSNILIPALIFIIIILAALGFGTSFYYYDIGQPFFAVLIVIGTLLSLRYLSFILDIAFLIVMLGIAIGALCLAGYITFEVGKAIAWSITDSNAQEKARKAASLVIVSDAGEVEEAVKEPLEKPKYKWEGPDTSGIVDDEPSFKAINPEAWAGKADPLVGLAAKPDTTQIVIEPGYKAIPCEGPFGKDTCIIKDTETAPEDMPTSEAKEQPHPTDSDNQPINTYL